MPLGQFALLSVLLVDVVLGILVFWTNSSRRSNQFFFLLSLAIAAWLFSLDSGFRASDAETIAFWVRQACAIGAFFPVLFNCLRLGITHDNASCRRILTMSGYWFASAIAVMLLTQTKFFLKGLTLSSSMADQYGAGEPLYGLGFLLYNGYYLGAIALLVYLYVVDTRRSRGFQQTELQFVMLATATCILVGSTLAIFLPLITGTSQTVPFVPIAILFLDGIIAYGIATQRILEPAYILRRLTAYGLLTTYLVALYAVVWLGSSAIFARFLPAWQPVSHLLAALSMAFSLAPAHGVLQRFSNRLFVTGQVMDVGAVVAEINDLVQSIRTVPNLLERFSHIVADAVGTNAVYVLLRNRSAFEQKYPDAVEGEAQRLIDLDEPLALQLSRSKDPIVADELRRQRPSRHLLLLARRLEQMDAAVAVGIRTPDHLEGILLLGPRISGRIYGSIDLKALPILCDQLAVALENAELYTETRDSKIYNEVLLDNLTSGVIAANLNGLVTVINREAQRITGLQPEEVVDKPFELLPPPLADTLETTFRTGQGLRDQDLQLRNAEDVEVPIRVGSSIFRGHTGNLLGALVVFNDLSTIKKLETQVRRTDRLASIGTLAAGMAHEIKNPLVTVKTFTQLLPERYQDEDFRDTFSTLIAQEVKRIDSIVNQLLNFARPAKPDLAPTHLHEVLEHSLRLVEQQLKRKDITLNKLLNAEVDYMFADANLMQQAIINFLLNAIDSMDEGGELHVSTDILLYDRRTGEIWSESRESRRIKLTIADTGCGIKPEDVSHIFDPFFTTKGHGTGLGLSVAHGIIQDHEGDIDVESVVGQGTAFHIVFPLRAEEAVA